MGTRSIRWPLAGLVFILAACLLVAVGYFFLQRWGRGSAPMGNAVTSVDVVAAYPGSSAEEVERQVTIPLEVTFAGTPNLKSIRGKSRFGLACLRLEFESGTDYFQARQEVISRLTVIDQPLPPGVSPVLSPASARHAILRYALRGPRDAQGKAVYTPADLRALQDWVVEREFRRVPRIADTTSAGGAVTRYEVHVDPDRLRRYGITLRQVQTAIAESNGNVGGDIVREGDAALTVRAVGLFGGGKDPMQDVLGLKDPHEAAARLRAEQQRRLREIRSLVLTTVNAAPVRLEDVVEGRPISSGRGGRPQGSGHRPSTGARPDRPRSTRRTGRGRSGPRHRVPPARGRPASGPRRREGKGSGNQRHPWPFASGCPS